MRVAALLGGLGRPVDGRHRAFPGRAVHAGDRDAPRSQVGDVALLEEDDLVRMGEDRGHVRGEEALAVGQPDDQRHVLARADQPVALAAMHDDDGVGPLDPAKRVADRVGQVARVGLLDEVGDRLGVGLRRQGVPASLEPVAQLAEVLDDPVVDDGDLTGAVLVGMGVQVVRPAVGGPARVGEPDRRVRGPVRDRRLEVGQLARPFLDEQVAGVVHERDPGRVVAAVFEPFQAFDEDGPGLPGPRVSDDAAHLGRLSVQCAAGPSGHGLSEGGGDAPASHPPEDSPGLV